jgi:periplasmic divalent cation tolerance protein
MPPPAFAVVLVTCPNRSLGERIGRALVEERLAACVNVIPGLTSLYRWEGKVQRGREVLLLIKTRRRLFPRLAARLTSLHPYSTPEILALPVAAGASRYLTWLAESTADSAS